MQFFWFSFVVSHMDCFSIFILLAFRFPIFVARTVQFSFFVFLAFWSLIFVGRAVCFSVSMRYDFRSASQLHAHSDYLCARANNAYACGIVLHVCARVGVRTNCREAAELRPRPISCLPTVRGTVPQKSVASRFPAAESRVRPTHIARCACVRWGETWPLSLPLWTIAAIKLGSLMSDCMCQISKTKKSTNKRRCKKVIILCVHNWCSVSVQQFFFMSCISEQSVQ